MRIAICGNKEQKKELLKKETNSSVEIAWFNEQQQSIENFDAYFDLLFNEAVNTKEEIDVAMKLGTNYPNGPCEWGKKIGLKSIYALLKKLNEKERCYEIAPSLISECEM